MLVVFLGTPHRGSKYTGWGEFSSNFASLVLQDSNKRIIKSGEENSEVLYNTNKLFRTILHDGGIKIHSFREGRGISGMLGVNKVNQTTRPSLLVDLG